MPTLTNEEAEVMDVLEAEPVHIHALTRQLSMAPGPLSGLLLQLELKGAAVQHPGKRFSLAPGIDPKLLK
jgi:predicted Rossmann fold nucleotide-binding protein DprA/Smf involved in DNA uptake